MYIRDLASVCFDSKRIPNLQWIMKDINVYVI